MATSPGQRFVRRQNAARSSTANGTAADITWDTPVFSEGGYTYDPGGEATVDEAGFYLAIYDIGLCDLASTRAVGTLVPSINTTDQNAYRASHRYLRNSGGAQDGCSFGVAFLDLAVNDDVKVRNPGALAPTDAVGNYATGTGEGGGFQLIRFPDGNYTEVQRTADAAEVGTSNINATRPWTSSSGTWTKITYNSEVQDDDNLYSGSGGDLTLAANTKYAIVYGTTCYSTDASRHTYVTGLNIGGTRVQTSSGYQRNTASQGPPMQGIYFHETGGSAETAFLEATHETEGGDAGTPQVADAYLQVLELPSSAEWIHVDNGTTDSMTSDLASTTTWYDMPLSSTFRADGDSNLSLDSANDAIQNDSGGTLPILMVGWGGWDRDAGTSGNRKAPMVRFNNGGTALQYGYNEAFSRGQQSADDTWQAHCVAAATFDLANAADATVQWTDRANASNSDMGIYAAGGRHLLGAQAFNLDTLDAGSVDDLLADDVQSTSETGSPSIGQEHDLLADDTQSTSEVSSPAIGQAHVLLADDVQGTSETETVSIGQTHALDATDVQSTSEVGSPTIGQTHAILADDTESASETDTPAIGQVHGLDATDVQSTSEVTNPTLTEVSGTHNLSADDVESVSQPQTVSLGQVHALLADDVESASPVGTPNIGQEHGLLADDTQSTSEVSQPTLSETSILLADDIESVSQVSSPSIGQLHGLNATDVESASEVTQPTATEIHVLDASDIEAVTETGSPSLATEYNLLAEDIVSITEVGTPAIDAEGSGGGSGRRQLYKTMRQTFS